MKVLFFIYVLLFLTHCTSVEEEEFCQKTNWRAQGKSDAFSGKTIDAFSQYNEDCQYYDVKLNKQAYYAGFQEGLMTFCTKERGESFGAAGGVYKNQCPANLEFDFIPAYNKAYKERLDSIKKQKQQKEDSIRFKKKSK